MDVVLSSGDEAAHLWKSDVPIDRRGPAADDVEDVGTTSAETLIPGPIGTDAPRKPKPLVAHRVTIIPPSGRHGQKHLCIATKRSDLVPQADQVMTQVELPRYHGPRSPLDLVALEIIFGHVFDVFHQMSRTTTVGAVHANEDKPLWKRRHQVSIAKKMPGI
jgi:hypothetical protein